MSSVNNILYNNFQSTVVFLNQPLIKESIKNIVGTVTFIFGLIEIYDICLTLQGKEITTPTTSQDPEWLVVAHKVIIVCAKISIILSALSSPPGVFLASLAVGCFFSAAQIENVFGPNTTFEKNPWHPRHVVSIAAIIFALPSIALTVYQTVDWVCRNIEYFYFEEVDNENNWLSDIKVKVMTLFNTATSRPILHIGNQLARSVLNPI